MNSVILGRLWSCFWRYSGKYLERDFGLYGLCFSVFVDLFVVGQWPNEDMPQDLKVVASNFFLVKA